MAVTVLCERIEKELLKRYENYADSEIKAEYSLNALSEAVGKDALIEGLLAGKRIHKCKCCGKPLITSGRGSECYCNRLFDGRRTCKEAGPALERKKDPVTREMDRARKLHLQRRAKAGKTTKACGLYDEWLSFALKKESACRSGRITIEELRLFIGADYVKDKGC